MSATLFGAYSTTSSTQGARGPAGVGIQSINSTDNSDGSVSLSITLTDGSVQGPFTSTLTSDSLIALNKLSLTGANNANKLQVVSNTGTTLFNVNTSSPAVTCGAMLDLTSGLIKFTGIDVSLGSFDTGSGFIYSINYANTSNYGTFSISPGVKYGTPNSNFTTIAGTSIMANTQFHVSATSTDLFHVSNYDSGTGTETVIFKVDTSTPRVDINTANFYINGSLYSAGGGGGATNTFTDAITISKAVSGSQFNAITISNTATAASSLAGIVFNYRNASNVAKSETLFVSDDEYICTSGNFAMMGSSLYCQGDFMIQGTSNLNNASCYTLTSNTAVYFHVIEPSTNGGGEIGRSFNYVGNGYFLTINNANFYGNNHYLQKSGVGNLLLKNNYGASTIPSLEISNPALTSANVLNIVPGYKGGTQTNGWVTYDVPGGGYHYFWDNVEISNDLTVGGNINCTNIIPSTTNSYTLGNSSFYFSTAYITTLNCGAINHSGTILPSANISYSLGSASRYYVGGYIYTLNCNGVSASNSITISSSVSATIAAHLTLTNSSTTNGSGTKLTMNGYGNSAARAAVLSFDGANVFLTNSNTVATWFGVSGTPSISLGDANNKFTALYATNGAIQTSDVNSKNSILDQTLGLDFIMQLRPVTYKMNVKHVIYDYDEVGNVISETPVPGTRRHHGLIAQEVKAVLDSNSISSDDFAGWCEEGGKQMLRYDEFISSMIKAIQELKTAYDALVA